MSVVPGFHDKKPRCAFLVETALGYGARGWPVLPCEPRGKRPLGRLVPHGVKQATTDLATIERFWRAEPDANIGLVTGIGFDALDIDAAGWGPWAHLVAEHGCVDLGPVVMTPGDGAHNLFLPTGLGNRAGFIAGCDWRGRDGYIIGAGSIHPNGGRYEWAIPPDESELVAPPTWLVDRLTRRAALIPPGPTTGLENASAYGQRALEAEGGKVLLAPVGQRNHALNCAAFNLGQLVASDVLEPYEVARALLRAAVGCGLEETEARRTINSGLRSGLARPRKVAA